MAISRGSETNSENTTFSHTVDGSANLLIVWVTWTQFNSNRNATVTYNGVAMTQVVHASSFLDTTYNEVMGFYLIDPATGANDVVVTYSGGTPGSRIHSAQDFIGADDTAPVDVVATQTGRLTTASISITPTTDDGFILDAIKFPQNRAFTPGTGQTELWDFTTAGGDKGAGSWKANASAGATTMEQSWDGFSTPLAYAAMALKALIIQVEIDVSDTISIGEDSKQDLDASVSDSISISENITISKLISILVQDTINITENFIGNLSAKVSSVISIAESIVMTLKLPWIDRTKPSTSYTDRSKPTTPFSDRTPPTTNWDKRT